MVFFEVADIINIGSIIINLISVFFIAVFFQNIQINSRTLKDYYIKEIDETLKKILIFIKSLEENKHKPQNIQNDFINHVSLLNNIGQILKSQYSIDLNPLITKFIALQQKVEDDHNFLNNFSGNSDTMLESNTIIYLKNYRYGELEKGVYDIILDINNYKLNIIKALRI